MLLSVFACFLFMPSLQTLGGEGIMIYARPSVCCPLIFILCVAKYLYLVERFQLASCLIYAWALPACSYNM